MLPAAATGRDRPAVLHAHTQELGDGVNVLVAPVRGQQVRSCLRSLGDIFGPATVVENGTAAIVADVGASFDVAVVDFFINDAPTTTARTAPFTLTLQAIPAFGKPGDRIKVSAVATDTSGNRGTSPTSTFVTVTPDQPIASAPVHVTDVIEIQLSGGYRVRIGGGVKAAALRLVLDVLERR